MDRIQVPEFVYTPRESCVFTSCADRAVKEGTCDNAEERVEKWNKVLMPDEMGVGAAGWRSQVEGLA